MIIENIAIGNFKFSGARITQQAHSKKTIEEVLIQKKIKDVEQKIIRC